MDEAETGGLLEWIIPLAFIVCMGWVIWHMPSFILDFLPPTSESLYGQIESHQQRKDVTPNLPAVVGGHIDIIDLLTLIALPILFFFGMRTVKIATMEFQDWRAIDRVAIFVGRVTMMLVLLMASVMMYEVFLRYVLEAPTLWANELTLWLAGFVFLCSGFYAMQQRSHIRIFIIYEIMPRWVQRVCDIISTILICTFAFFLVFGSYKQVFIKKFYQWEMFGTAFDPPIPATIQPMILIIVTLIAIQSVINLIADWDAEPMIASKTDMDAEELEAIKRSVGAN
ncbi:TRAP transporter small permease subunit [Yoonia sp.]|jgi:TRAP-type mannitol/chloroaromatic compound transport system permease small subunit|uniref:TRAP transporter small permease subunit n=1 Tax=Yoonia sp. TaxID=2212373 RepID=UPI002392DC18|nr:TRAP transporter small permease subunit [Yoonia sp.]MDE0850336.1 TRAP transporter small permease subunit [Yoonia sp.]